LTRPCLTPLARLDGQAVVSAGRGGKNNCAKIASPF
jgi:hypothetical protein